MNTMNKFKSVIVLAAVLFASAISVSCSSDDDSATKATIVGTWLETASSTETFVNNVSTGISTNTVDADNFLRFTFNANGTFSEFYSELLNGIVETSTDSGTYSVTGSTLTFTYDGDTDVEEIEFTLTNNQLVTIFTEEDTANDTRFVGTTTFTRQ